MSFGGGRKPRYVLLSIHPWFVDQILNGIKYYEFRKKFPLHADRFVFYSTSPIQKIVGVAERSHMLIGGLDYLWKQCSASAGMSRKDFDRYYEGKTRGIAIGLTQIKQMKYDLQLKDIDIQRPPQSFMYLSEMQWNWVKNAVKA